MAKELSIKTIKEELMDRMMNNVEVLKYLEVDKYTRNGRSGKIQDIYNGLIFDYDGGNFSGNFVAIEVGETEISTIERNDNMDYSVSIRIGLNHKENLDKLASTIKDIVYDLYPDRKRLRNVPIYGSSYDFKGNEYKDLNRMITFEIK